MQNDNIILLAVVVSASLVALVAIYLFIRLLDTRPDVVALLAVLVGGVGLMEVFNITSMFPFSPFVVLFAAVLLLFTAAFAHNRSMQP